MAGDEETKKIENMGEETVKIEREEDERAATAIRAVRTAYLVCVDGPFFGKKYLLKPEVTKIGREGQFNDIVLKGDTVASRRHATIEVKGGEYVIWDKRSRNRTFVNQKEVKENEEVVLHPGDEIEIGKNIFRFCYENKLDFSPPRRGGTLMKRWKYRLLYLGSLILLVIFGREYKTYKFNVSILSQKPVPINIELNTLSIEDENPLLSIGNCDNQGGLDIPIIKNKKVSLFDIKKNNTVWESDLPGVIMAYTSNFFAKSKHWDIICHTTDPKISVIDGKFGRLLATSDLLSGKLTNPSTCVNLTGIGDIAVVSEQGYFSVLKYKNGNLTSPTPGKIPYNVYSSPVIIPKKQTILISTDKYVYYCDEKGNITDKIDLLDTYSNSQGSAPINWIDVRATPAVDFTKKRIGVFTRYEQFIDVDYSKNPVFVKSSPKISKGTPQKTGSPVIADLNRDGYPDFIIPSYQENKVIALNGKDGSKIWAYQGEGGFLYTPALADVNKDGTSDVIIGDDKGYVYIIDGRKGTEIYKKKVSDAGIQGSAVVGDIYGDMRLGIVVKDKNGTLYTLKTNADIFHDEVMWAGYMGTPDRCGMYKRDALTLSMSKRQMNVSLLIIVLTLVFDVGYWFNRKRKVQK